MSPSRPRFFASPADFRAWLATHHATHPELLVGFYKKGTGKPSITWPEAVDEALCFGWIDGVRRSLGDEAYMIRFTPRRPTSNWSRVNVARVAVLTKAGKMTPAGQRAFDARRPERTGVYSFEGSAVAQLPREDEDMLRANPRALAFWEAQPPWYRRSAIHWIMSAKRPETRRRRLEQLIRDSAAGRTVPPLTRPTAKSRPRAKR